MTEVMVFTRDLRVRDNSALANALAASAPDGARDVVPLFVLDPRVIERHRSPNRAAFLLDSLLDLDQLLRERGGRLIVRRSAPGNWAHEVASVARAVGASRVHLSEDVSALAQRRIAALEEQRLEVLVHAGIAVVDLQALKPYQVFTPYYRAWLAAPRRTLLKPPARVRVPDSVSSVALEQMADELEVGPTSSLTARPATARPRGGASEGEAWLRRWAARSLASYANDRDDLASDATSHISAYLHFGCLSPNEVATRLHARDGAEAFVRQLAWRDFYLQLLLHRPEAADRDLRTRPAPWRDDESAFATWQRGETGYPLVDAGMRQLRNEGFMHNRARMVTASVLTKHLLIDWRAGARHFLDWLVDGDLAQNQLNWQWVAGTGTDTNPHRMFNPARQGVRFDPQGDYVRRYVPELSTVPTREIHEPSASTRARAGYPPPLIDHLEASRRYRGSARTRQPNGTRGR